MHWQTITIIGVGLIGGSLGLALKRAGVAGRIVGVGRNAQRLAKARARGLVTEVTTSLKAGVATADLVVVCSPVDHIVRHAVAALNAAPSHAVVTDVGSTKASIIRDVERLASSAAKRFVGGHPIAGSEQRGADWARPDLFDGRTVVLTPTPLSANQAVYQVRKLWESVGAKTVMLPAGKHDRILATTSHLPHVVAAALANATPLAYLHLAGSGWADTTRIAAGDVDLWTAILLDNRHEILPALKRFQELLEQLRRAIDARDVRRLKNALRRGKKHRDALGS